jgi:hypothetical protein
VQCVAGDRALPVDEDDRSTAMGEVMATLGNELGEAIRGLPTVVRAWWDFGRGFFGVAIMLGSAALVAMFLFLAKQWREDRGWLSAIAGMMAGTIGAFWAFGILPSAWVYFVDGRRDLLEGLIIPGAIDPVWSNFYLFFRDSIVGLETAVAVVVFAVIAVAVQRRYPRKLAEGEEARPQSGGYK